MIEIQQLRDVRIEQFHQIQDLFSTLSEHSVFSPDMLAETLKSSLLYVAVQNERIVGMATLCLFTSPSGRKASVEDVVVHKDWQGKGVGRKLMNAIIDKARESCPITLQLTSRPERLVANLLYPSLGFQRKDTNFYVLKL